MPPQQLSDKLVTRGPLRYHVIVPELLRELLKRERRAATPGLRPLAARVGVLS